MLEGERLTEAIRAELATNGPAYDLLPAIPHEVAAQIRSLVAPVAYRSSAPV